MADSDDRIATSDLRESSSLGVLLEALVIGSILFIVFQDLNDGIYFSIYQARDIDRAYAVAAGHSVLFGPEMSGGGHLPGGFYYGLLALALKLVGGWKSCWELAIFLLATSGAALWFFTRRFFGVLSACLTLSCVFSPKWMLLVVCSFMNPSFLPVFIVFSLIMLCGAFAGIRGRRSFAWSAFCLICGLGIQLHLAFLFILLSGVVIQLSAQRLQVPALGKKIFFLGLFLFLVPLLPYGAWFAARTFSLSLGQSNLPFTGQEIIGWSFTLGRMRAFDFHAVVRDFPQRLRSLLPAEVWIALFLLAVARSIAAPSPESDETDSPDLRFTGNCPRILTIAAVSTCLPCLFWVLTPERFLRYSTCFHVAVSLLIGAFAARRDRLSVYASGGAFAALVLLKLYDSWWLASFTDTRHFLFSILGGIGLASLVFLNSRASIPARALFPVISVLPLLISLNCLASVRFVSLLREPHPILTNIRMFKAMARHVYAQTGWTYAEAKRRIFYVNHNCEQTPAHIYREVEAEAERRFSPRLLGINRIDGYFVGHPSLPTDLKDSTASKRWPLGEDLEGTLRAGIKAGKIRLGEPSRYEGLVIVPYQVTDAELLPPYFHNLSEGYSFEAVSTLRPMLGERTFRLTFNDCPWKDPVYNIFADVGLNASSRNHWAVRVILSGEPISQSSHWVSPDWTQRLIRPYFSYSCGENSRTITLAESIGRNSTMFTGGSFIAPYERTFTVTCAEPIRDFAVGYESSRVFSKSPVLAKPLPGRKILIRTL